MNLRAGPAAPEREGNNVRIRYLAPEQAACAAGIERGSLATAFSERQIIECALGKSAVKYLVLLEGEAVRGVCSFALAADECEIINLAVEKDSRRKGYGAKLLKAVFKEARAKGAEKAFLEVAEDNAAAISLYENNGFTPAGGRKNFYRGVDAIIMEKDL
jgi:ribosomal-protein-alanine N-acetyltransferase